MGGRSHPRIWRTQDTWHLGLTRTDPPGPATCRRGSERTEKRRSNATRSRVRREDAGRGMVARVSRRRGFREWEPGLREPEAHVQSESTTGATETPHSGRLLVGKTNQVSSWVQGFGLNNTAEGCIDRRSSCSWPNQRVRAPSRPSGQVTRSVFRDTHLPQVTSSPCLSKRWTDPDPPVRHPVEIETDPVRWRPWEGTSQRSQARARSFEASTTLQARFSASGSNRQGNKRERNRHVGVFHATTWCHAGGTPPSGSCNTQDEDPTRELRRSVWAIGFEADENRPTPRTARRRVPCVWECAMETAARCASVP